MNIESLMLNVCELLKSHKKRFNKLSAVDTFEMPLSEKLRITQLLCTLNGAIIAYEHVLDLCEDRTMKGGEE